MTEGMLETFHPNLDAANVDLKAFRDETYCLQDGKTNHYTEIRCEEDELAHMWALYPRDG